MSRVTSRIALRSLVVASLLLIGSCSKDSPVAPGGPSDFWQPTGGPLGGGVTALAVLPGGSVIAGTLGGVFRSSNGGASWTATPMSEPVSGLGVSASGHLFASSEISRLYRSTDQGVSWTPVSGVTMTHSRSLAVSGGTLFAGSWGAGVLRSTDNGASWTVCGTGVASEVYNTLATDGAGLVFAGTSSGLHRSADNGDTWAVVYTGSGGNTVEAFALDASGTVFA